MGRQAFRAPTVVRIRTSICEYVIKSRDYVNCNYFNCRTLCLQC